MVVTFEQVAQIYVATFNRAPDTSGINYWLTQSFGGHPTIEQIASSFFDQPEAQQFYETMTTTADLVTAAYNNLFNRNPEQAGLDYWVHQLDTHAISQSNMLLALVNGALGDDAVIMKNKTAVGLDFADAGLNDTSLALDVIAGVTADLVSVAEAQNEIGNHTDTSHKLVSEAINLGFENDFVGDVPVENNIPYVIIYPDDDISELFSTPLLQNTYALTTYEFKIWNADGSWQRSDLLNSKWPVDTITYSFNTTIPTEFIGTSFENQWQVLTQATQEFTRSIFDNIEEFTSLHFLEVPNNEGMIRYSLSRSDGGWAGITLQPTFTTENSVIDIFLATDYFSVADDTTFQIGNGLGMAISHETAHALGLNHPFEGNHPLADDLDNTNHTIMSYTFSLGRYPEYFSMFDIAALQMKYGANLQTRIGDDLYSALIRDDSPYSPIPFTLWDAGGRDTIDLSDSISCNIDMNSGTFNTYKLVEWDDWSIDNFAISYGTIIENLITGNGNDIIHDNDVDNIIKSGLGDDTIYLGAGGYDIVDGNGGYDTVVLDCIQEQCQYLLVNQGLAEYRLAGDDFSVTLFGIEQLNFTNGFILLA